MNFEELEYVVRSNSGQDGVYFISDGKRRKVLKASPNSAEELFLTNLVKQLNLNSPQVEIIHPLQREYNSLITAIFPFVEEENALILKLQAEEIQKEPFIRDQELMEKRILELNKPQIFLLMEEIKGRSLRDVTLQDLEEWYGDDIHLNQKGKNFFRDIGKLLIIDLLIRNIDRFIFWKLPGIGEVEYALGNLGNIMIQDETHELIVIDTLSNREINISNYCDAVKEILKRTVNGEPDNLINRGKETIELTGYEVRENGIKEIQQGIEQGINQVQSQIKKEKLFLLKQNCLEQLPFSQAEQISELASFVSTIVKECLNS